MTVATPSGPAHNGAGSDPRRTIKRGLARLDRLDRPGATAARGCTVLIYHRVGGGTADERDVTVAEFATQMRQLAEHHEVVSVDDALATLDAGDDRPMVVITFDDGFADVARVAMPVLVDHGLQFTVYLATAYLGGEMSWEGSTAKEPGAALSWAEVEELVGTGLCTVGNHTHGHVRPEALTEAELDACTDAVRAHLGIEPAHFAYPWGVPVPAAEPALRARFRSAVTGELGRNRPGVDPMRLKRVPVRGSDPIEFFSAKLRGGLGAEASYGALVAAAKRLGVSA